VGSLFNILYTKETLCLWIVQVLGLFSCIFMRTQKFKDNAILFFRQSGEDSKMLVCDTCDKGYHTFCLQPVMKSVPTNGWKCKVSDFLICF
jgi:hypothetical protein